MTNNSDRDNSPNKGTGDKKTEKRVIGEGMTSLDSTQAPLKSETGEPDWEAMTGGKPDDKNKDQQGGKR